MKEWLSEQVWSGRLGGGGVEEEEEDETEKREFGEVSAR